MSKEQNQSEFYTNQANWQDANYNPLLLHARLTENLETQPALRTEAISRGIAMVGIFAGFGLNAQIAGHVAEASNQFALARQWQLAVTSADTEHNYGHLSALYTEEMRAWEMRAGTPDISDSTDDAKEIAKYYRRLATQI